MSLAAVVALVAASVGLLLLGVMGVTLFGQVKSLGRTVARASDRLASVDAPPPRRESAGPGQTNTG
ncbi:MAG TPA: hypothetical protein VNB94_10345 [Mycobacteriales bacterium]|nr:hypothetical protein [Mycobacteriales bacterium]